MLTDDLFFKKIGKAFSKAGKRISKGVSTAVKKTGEGLHKAVKATDKGLHKAVKETGKGLHEAKKATVKVVNSKEFQKVGKVVANVAGGVVLPMATGYLTGGAASISVKVDDREHLPENPVPALYCDSEGYCYLWDELARSNKKTNSPPISKQVSRGLKARLMKDTSSNTWSPTLMTDDLLLGQCTPAGYSCQDSMHCCDKLACIRTGGSGGMMTTACGVNPFPRL